MVTFGKMNALWFCVPLLLYINPSIMLRLFSFKAQGGKEFWKPSEPSCVGNHWKALAEHSQMSTHMPGLLSFFSFLNHFVLAKLATSSMRVK